MSIHLLQPGRPLLGNLRCQSLVLVSTHLLQPCRPLLGSLRCQSVPQALQPGLPCSAVSDTSLSSWLALICCSLAVFSSAVSDTSLSCCMVSTHLLQPGRPLLGSLRCQSPTTGSAHLLQCTLPPLRTLCSASSSVPLSPLPQSVSSAVSPARRVLSRSLLRRSLSYLFCEDPVVSMLVANVNQQYTYTTRRTSRIDPLIYHHAHGYWPPRAAAHDDIHIRGAPPRVTNLDPRGLFDVR